MTTTNIKDKIFHFARWSVSGENLDAIIRVKAGNQFKFLFQKLKFLIGGRVTKSFGFNLNPIHRTLRNILLHSGKKGLVLYLKSCSVCLQQAAAEHLLNDLTPLKYRISRTKGSKLPRIISVRHRLIILNKLPGRYILVRFYLTLFSLYRLIYFQPIEDLSSITDSGPLIDLV